MSDKLFFEKQFALKNIPKGSGKYEDLEKCNGIVRRQGKLSSLRYNEYLKIAAEYVGYKEGE